MADATLDRSPFALSETPTEPELVGKYFRALGDPTRVRILELLRVQTWLDRSGVWARLGGGCHCARDTVDAIKTAGFRVERLQHVAVGPAWEPANPYVVGVAT